MHLRTGEMMVQEDKQQSLIKPFEGKNKKAITLKRYCFCLIYSSARLKPR